MPGGISRDLWVIGNFQCQNWNPDPRFSFLEAEGNDKSRKSSTTKSFRRSNSANDLKNDSLSKGDDSTRLESDVSVGSLGGYADELDDAFADVLSPGSIRSNSSGLSHWIYIPSFDLEKILTSGKYTLVSACFGTMIAFFLVGMRVEVMLLHAQALKDLENTSQWVHTAKQTRIFFPFLL